VNGLTDAASAEINEVFRGWLIAAPARMALFDGDRQVSEWVDYAVDGSAAIPVHHVGVTHLRLQTGEDAWLNLAIRSPVNEGDSVSAPALQSLYVL